MLVTKDIGQYIARDTTPLRQVLERINVNRMRGIFVVDEPGRLLGVMTDGDFRRWLVRQPVADLDTPVCEVLSEHVVSAHEDTPLEAVENLLTNKVTIVPILDDWSRIVAIAGRDLGGLRIGAHKIEDGKPVFIIAEIGNNHNGDTALAKRLVDEAIAAGADCVKFQMRDLETLYGGASHEAQDLGVEYTLDLLKRHNLPPKLLYEIFDYAYRKGIIPLCTPWDVNSLRSLESYGLEAYKVASADLTNLDLLSAIAGTHKPMLMSTGMSRESEIRAAVAHVQSFGAQYALLHCNSTYPAPYEDVNLRFMQRLKDIGGCPVGYSSHERGITVCLGAVAMGAAVIEKHFTLDKTMEGNDHKVSLLPGEFAEMVAAIRQLETALGTSRRPLNQGEMLNREVLAKSLVATRTIQVGETITPEMATTRSPGKGLQPIYLPRLLGQKAKRVISEGDCFFQSDLNGNVPRPGAFRFRRPWGIPVRYHDCNALLERSSPDFVEYHLTYRDLEVDLSTIAPELPDRPFIVHAPELFAGDHLLDLCAPDPAYRRRSVDELRRVIDTAQVLRDFAPCETAVPIVVNVGGFSRDCPLTPDCRARMYDELAEVMLHVKAPSIEILAQTMPPFPWHFGGQSFHNLFVRPDEIAAFCEKAGARVCLDISHSKLACNSLKLSLTDFIDTLGSCIGHLHLSDASGLRGEGLQIGEGDISFASIAKHLDRVAPNVGFIPEVWQGHKNAGEGFWTALHRLEKWF